MTYFAVPDEHANAARKQLGGVLVEDATDEVRALRAENARLELIAKLEGHIPDDGDDDAAGTPGPIVEGILFSGGMEKSPKELQAENAELREKLRVAVEALEALLAADVAARGECSGMLGQCGCPQDIAASALAAIRTAFQPVGQIVVSGESPSTPEQIRDLLRGMTEAIREARAEVEAPDDER